MKNVLLLVADDLGSYLGCYGCETIHTPNIDRLAEQGTLFDMAFASTASCSGSRSTLYTGLHTHQNGQYGLAGGRQHFTTFEHVNTLPKIFNEMGYLTGIIGKVHVGPASVYPWQVWEEDYSRNVEDVSKKARAFFSMAMREQRPFHCTIGFVDPHRDRTRSGFGNDEVPDFSLPTYSELDVEIPSFLTDHPLVRKELAEYYRSVTRLDYGVGLVLAELQASGMAEDTLIVFVSDNGPPFINSKTTLYDAGIRLPLIIKQPGATGGIVSYNMVSFIDILPTTVDWCNGDDSLISKSSLGRSVLPILGDTQPREGWNQVFGSHTFHEVVNYWPTRYLRTRQFKYHRNIAWKLDFPFAVDLYGSLTWEAVRNQSPAIIGRRSLKRYIRRPPEELYDLDSDPFEVNNLARSENHQDILKRMRQALEKWQQDSDDPWLFRDGVSLTLTRHHVAAGMPLPDRFDFDVEDPGTESVPLFKA